MIAIIERLLSIVHSPGDITVTGRTTFQAEAPLPSEQLGMGHDGCPISASDFRKAADARSEDFNGADIERIEKMTRRA
jgi:hypothetical protein